MLPATFNPDIELFSENTVLTFQASDQSELGIVTDQFFRLRRRNFNRHHLDEIPTHMLYLIVLFIVPYLCFFVFGKGLNPILKPRKRSKRPGWRYGRAMALASLPGTIGLIAVLQSHGSATSPILIIGVTVSLLLGVVFSRSKIIRFFRY